MISFIIRGTNSIYGDEDVMVTKDGVMNAVRTASIMRKMGFQKVWIEEFWQEDLQ